MNLTELQVGVEVLIKNLKDNGVFPKENENVDYKRQLNHPSGKTPMEVFLVNFMKDLISFSNTVGGIILLGIEEDGPTGKKKEVGLPERDLKLLKSIDLNLVDDQLKKATKLGLSLDLQHFRIGSKEFYYILVPESHATLIPASDQADCGLKNGDIWYRKSSKNVHANKSSAEFTEFVSMKSQEKSKEFMEIWSKLLPEMFEINPRKVLLLNPSDNRVYGYNSKENKLSATEVAIDQSEGVFQVILNAITAGEIGKITTDEGKPIYKIVGEVQSQTDRPSTSMSTLVVEIAEESGYSFNSVYFKKACMYLGWVTTHEFVIQNPNPDHINGDKIKHLWVKVQDSKKDKSKVVFSPDAGAPILDLVRRPELHIEVFGRLLQERKSS